MKRTIIASFISLAISLSLNSCNSVKSAALDKHYDDPTSVSRSAAAAVSESLSLSFSKTFPSAENVKWTGDANGYFVSFTQFGIPSKAAYDPQDDFLYAMRYYNEENLPVSVLVKLKKKFADKKISSVTESSTPDNITYHVKLEDKKSWYTVEVTTSGDPVIEEYFKK